ncbi:hypothetical protein [Planobispora takensis]|uniref:Uncharacterized protein n=1 Tax=Planobispora takensis TaxID=1367882 RepID=A0A8J3T881_9ACTN|nr:hypothetical protein [Planobispora takensis]GII02719.1 hypothetical protein Pta02_47270 [Planobispora takensis]
MVRLLKRALVPARLRRAVRGRLDARYVLRPDHRRDLAEVLGKVRELSGEVAALRAEGERLRAEVERLRGRTSGVTVSREQTRRWDDAHRLALETATAMDRTLQNEVLLWQAVDRARAEAEGTLEAGDAPAATGPGRAGFSGGPA